MISESALARACRPAILGRARIIVQHPLIGLRTCSYEGDLTHLSACVESSTSLAERYETSITLDETADEVFAYDCTCPAAERFRGPCKHSIALALDFSRRPQQYEGYQQLQHVVTSTALASYLDRAAKQVRPRLAREGEGPQAAVRVLPRLMRSNALFCSLRLEGAQGAYVVRDLVEFEGLVSTGGFFEYGKKLAFSHDLGAFDERDRELVRFVCRCVRNRRSYGANRTYGHVYATGGSSLAASKELRLSGPETDELLALLVGRVVSYEASPPGATQVEPCEVLVEDGDPQLSLSIEAYGDEAYELIRHGEADVFSTDERTYAVQNGRLYRCTERFGVAAPFVQQVYCSPLSQLVMTREDGRRFLMVALPALEHSLEVSVPPQLDALRPDPLRLIFTLDYANSMVTCDALATYGERTVQLFDRAQGDDLLWRDVAGEARARQVVSRYFTTVRDGGVLLSRPDAESVARIVFEGVEELRRLGSLHVSEAFRHLKPLEHPRVRVRVSSHAGLIDLSVSSDDLPASELYALLGSYRQRKHYHQLRNGMIVDLFDAELDEAARMADELGLTQADLSVGTVRVPSYKAFLLDALMPDSEKDESFVACLEGFRTVDPSVYEPPVSLVAQMRPYQVTGYRWLCSLVDMGFGGILADEMGLGKSLQVIALLLARRGRGQTLVVCPASLVYNWQAEFRKFAPQLDVAVVAGTAAERKAIRSQAGHEVLITSYDLLRRDIEEYASRRLWCVVLDEAQFVKNHQTLTAHAVKVLDARHRLALTGTPVENRLSELWSIFDFLMPGLLGSADRFRERYEGPISEGDQDAARLLRAAVEPFVLRRRKAEVLDDLPDKLEQVVTCRMGRTQRTLYAAREQALRESVIAHEATLGSDRMQVLAEITRLRQLCCDPRLVYEDYDGGSCKIDTVWQLVAQAVDARSKVLVFSQFTSFLSLISERLDQEGVTYYTITGATPKRRRVELVDAFNNDETPVFLVSLRAGGTGLNLVGASVVIHADPWWNVAVQNQATDRAHRIGQTRDVTVFKVIAADTIEERIVLLQESKSDLADRFVGEGGGLESLAALRPEDLAELLGAEG